MNELRKWMLLVENQQTFYHGTSSPAINDDQLRPSSRGYFGPGVYLSAQPSVARAYGDYVHSATVRGNIYQAWANRRGTLEIDPTAHDRIISGLSDDDKARVLSLKSWYGKDSEAFYQALSRKASPEAARDALKRAGYDGIEGIGDGHEICVFDPHNVMLHRSLIESENDLDAHLRRWVAGNPNDQTHAIMHDLALNSETKVSALSRNHHSDPNYTVGQTVDFPPLSFSQNDSNNKHGIASEWSSKHKSIFHIENPRKGFDIPYNKNYQFGAHNERETILAGRYRVKHHEMVDEPHTNGAYKVPKYTFTEE